MYAAGVAAARRCLGLLAIICLLLCQQQVSLHYSSTNRSIATKKYNNFGRWPENFGVHGHQGP